MHHLRRSNLVGHPVTSPNGMYHGEFWNHSIHVDGASPALLIGGSGVGKLASLIGYSAIVSPGCRRVYVDPKGEICSISLDNLARWGKGGYVINPLSMSGLPQHTVDPFAFVRGGAISMTSDAKLLAADLISITSKDNPFFEKRARAWVEAFIIFDAITAGCASLARVYRYVQIMMERDSDAWSQLAVHMARTSPEIATIVNEIVSMQGDDGRAYGIITADINSAFSFMTDPAVRMSLSEKPDLDLEEFVNASRDNDIYFLVPAELMEIWSPFIRLIISSLMILKRRVPHAPQIDFLVDEAGQLQAAAFLPTAMTFGRGAGIKTYAVFQDIGQIQKWYGSQGLTTFLGSAETRQFIGIRDPHTARMVSSMLGQTSLRYIDEAKRDRALKDAKRAMLSGLVGGQSFTQAVIDAKAAKAEALIESQMPRALAMPDELLRQPNGSSVLFVSGRGCPPILGQLKPYFQRRELNGFFFENPHHPPYGRLKLKGRFGYHWKDVIEVEPPASIRHLPQYRQGRPFRFVDGYRPKI